MSYNHLGHINRHQYARLHSREIACRLPRAVGTVSTPQEYFNRIPIDSIQPVPFAHLRPREVARIMREGGHQGIDEFDIPKLFRISSPHMDPHGADVRTLRHFQRILHGGVDFPLHLAPLFQRRLQRQNRSSNNSSKPINCFRGRTRRHRRLRLPPLCRQSLLETNVRPYVTAARMCRGARRTAKAHRLEVLESTSLPGFAPRHALQLDNLDPSPPRSLCLLQHRIQAVSFVQGPEVAIAAHEANRMKAADDVLRLRKMFGLQLRASKESQQETIPSARKTHKFKGFIKGETVHQPSGDKSLDPTNQACRHRGSIQINRSDKVAPKAKKLTSEKSVEKDCATLSQGDVSSVCEASQGTQCVNPDQPFSSGKVACAQVFHHVLFSPLEDQSEKTSSAWHGSCLRHNTRFYRRPKPQPTAKDLIKACRRASGLPVFQPHCPRGLDAIRRQQRQLTRVQAGFFLDYITPSTSESSISVLDHSETRSSTVTPSLREVLTRAWIMKPPKDSDSMETLVEELNHVGISNTCRGRSLSQPDLKTPSTLTEIGRSSDSLTGNTDVLSPSDDSSHTQNGPQRKPEAPSASPRGKWGNATLKFNQSSDESSRHSSPVPAEIPGQSFQRCAFGPEASVLSLTDLTAPQNRVKRFAV